MTTRYAPSRILIGCPNWVGDAVMATPVLRAVRNCFPESHIALLCKPGIAELLDGLPFFDETIDTPAPGDGRTLMNAAMSLRKERFELGLLLTHSFRSALLARLAGIPRRVGYDLQGRGFLLTDPLQPLKEGGKKQPRYMVDEYLGIVTHFGCAATDTSLQLAVSSEARSQVRELLTPSGRSVSRPLVGIAPGAFFGPSKLWYGERWAAVVDALVERFDASIIIPTAPVERELYEQIASNMNSRPVPLDGTAVPLELLKAIVSELDLLLCTDCGARHIAVAFGVPTVVLMGPTDPRYTSSDCEKGVVIREEVACSPCHKKVCPTDHECMRKITPEMVVNAAASLLERVDIA
jgi:heptosyltransferase-2